MKEAIFLVVDTGIDGREPARVVFASRREDVRDMWFEESPRKNWYHKKDIVADLDEVAWKTWARLDGLEQFALLRPDCDIWLNTEHLHPDIEATT